jgi:peptidoglycan/xylan/chitin deacetylase (PgdA/CDA1 family)
MMPIDRDSLLHRCKSIKFLSRSLILSLAVMLTPLGFSSSAATLSRGAIAQLPSTTLDGESLEGETELPKQACSLPPDRSALQINDLTQNLMQAATWIEEPENGLGAILQSVGPQLAAQLTPAVWPEIHQRSRLARVPILMYHDIPPEKEVFFDVTPEEFREHLELIKENGLTPVSMDQLVAHLRTGLPLPEKPVLLAFDDGYKGHYDYVLPLLQEYGYPGLFSIYTYKVSRDHGRPGLTWEQLEQMAADPLVTIAAHSVMHPTDLRELSDETLQQEIIQSRQILQERLGIQIRYFTYPEGKYDARVAGEVRKAGFEAALTMNDAENLMAGESTNLLAIDRIGQSQIEEVIADAWGGPSPKRWGSAFDFTAPIRVDEVTYDDVPLILISGGKPVTIHADSRYQVEEIIAGSEVAAAVDGGFFSLKYLDSNVMVGPVLSQSEGVFVPGNASENPLLNGRPLVLIGPNQVRFVPFEANKHNTLEGVQAEMADVTDAFVAAAWLVKDGEPQSASTFGSLFDFDARRHRAFWGISQDGQPVIGVSTYYVDSISLGEMLYQSGLQDAVMLDSGASTSLAYQGESLVSYTPRPVPHVVGLVPPQSDSQANVGCTVASQ